jgi:hypothetical protein
VYVQWTHKDANHEALVVEVGVLFRFLYHHNLSVGRGNNQFVGVAIEVADRAAIEVENHEPGSYQYTTNERHHNVACQWIDGIEKIPQSSTDCKDSYGTI